VLPDRVEFNRDIRPILSDNCFQCHGPDKNTREAGLRLDLREEAVAIRDGAVAIVPGDSATSHLVKRITNPDPNYHMPPAESEKALSKHEIALLTRWVEQGAEYQSHWAYIKPVAAPMPKVQGEAWVRNPIDHFVLARLEADGLTPSAEADRVTLIRRLSFDLIGLPPKPEEVAAFVYDSRANAYEHLVDRLLASEHFGERMAIYWLDLVRYADTVGYHGDQTRGASAYRDYIINAFNANLPFDRFTRDQLAGDLLESPTQEQILATGYNRLNMVTREGGAQDMDYLVRYAADRVRTTASVWMGSSLGCAQCHDHKFDPFTTQDFYSFGAFFADIKERGVQSESGNEGPFPPFVAFPTDEEVAEMEMLTTRLAELGTLLENPEAPNLEDLQKEHRDTQRKKHHLEASMVTSAVTESAEPRMMRVLARGNWQDESGAVVTPAVPAFIGGLESGSAQSTRLDLAAWLTSAENPLTARVFVNRLWKMCFGTGISKVLDDVGSQGEWPTHPELLDHLAVVFMDSGWDIKHTIRYIVTSATYRQASAVSPELRERDPYNRLMARQSRFRLEAELVRDNALRISGLLVPTVGGRSVRPYQPAGYYRELNFPVREYQVDTGENLYRRGVYTHWQRTFLHPSLLAFDAPNREECTAERTISNSPLQALVLMNDPTYIEAARVFAERIVREGGESVDARIAWAYRHALSRAPNTREAEVMADLYARHRAEFAEDRGAAAAFIDIGEMPAPAALDAVELAAWSSVSRTLFNLHETIYRY
jgi:hypothetical protein